MAKDLVVSGMPFAPVVDEFVMHSWIVNCFINFLSTLSVFHCGSAL